MVSASQIDILLSTYNGEKYLGKQLESIVAQNITDWHLIVRDDGSDDTTLSIIYDFSLLYPDKVTILKKPSGRLGIVGSFECLLEHSTALYIAFCDQDDVWLPNKLQLLRDGIQRIENESDRSMPILVHSDLLVVDKSMNILSDSFWTYQKLNPSKMQKLERLLVQNCVTGCATIVNRSLLNVALPIPKGAIMHDWWFALVAVSKGKIGVLNTRTVKYRQHAMNDTGAMHWNISYALRAIFKCDNESFRKNLINTRLQAIALLEFGVLDDDQHRVVSHYIKLFECSWLLKRFWIIRLGFFQYGFIRNMAFLFRV